MNPVTSYQDTFIGNVKDEDLEIAFNKSFQHWSEKAKNLVVTPETSGVQHLKNVWSLSSANPSDVKEFHNTFVKSSKEVKLIISWFKARDSKLDFHKVCAIKNTHGEVINAANQGHAMAIEFRREFCDGTVLVGAKNVKVAASKIELIKSLWAELNVPKERKEFSQKGSLAQSLKEHKMMHGDFKTLPELCFQKDKKGVYYMSKFLVSDNKDQLFNASEIEEMKNTLKSHPKGDEVTKAMVNLVLIDDPNRAKKGQQMTELIKKNSMTMDYGFMFWLVMYLGKFSISQIIEVLLNCHNINMNSTSDKKCMKYINGKYEGFKNRVGTSTVALNETFGALKNVIIEFKGVEKLLQDNPFFITDKVVLEVLKIAGSFPMIYNKGKIFGFHELFCIKNLIRLNVSKRVIDNFMKELDENDKAKGHIIHRGLVGSLFSNISKIDSDLVTFSIKA